MIKGIAFLSLFQLLGESVVFTSGLPLPGPVVGLIFLFAAMQLCKVLGFGVFRETEAAADGFLANLGLLFVPAGVGIIALLGELRSQAGVILAVLVVSAVLTLAITVWTFVIVRRFVGRT